MIFLLVGIALFYAWRYSKSSVDPDWAFFNLYAFTGAVYGKDFVDCKTPGVHVWFWLLSKLVGKDVARIRFANHFLVSLPAIPVFYAVGIWPAIAYITLVNSGWLLSFHGNVGNVPAALVVLALLTPPWLAIPLWLAAVFYEPKLVLSFIVITVIKGWWGLAALAPLGGVIYLVFRNRQWFKWLWESSVTIPARMAKWRRTAVEDLSLKAFPWCTANATLYLAPWVALGVLGKPDVLYWLPPLVYVLFIATGTTIRQNHLLPIIPWMALAVSPLFAVILCAVDWVSAGFYTGNVWKRFYSALNEMNDEAKQTGEWLKDKPGTLYVNGIHSGIYLYAKKPPALGMTEQIEIRDVATERRSEMVRRWKENPPDWVVVGDVGGINFTPSGYIKQKQIGVNVIFRKA